MVSIIKSIVVTRILIETGDGFMETELDNWEVEQFIAAREWVPSKVRLIPGRRPATYGK